jgi:membrane protein DedA with SNARE-associated domain
MAPAPDLLAQHGVAVLVAWAFAVQAGVPVPADPILVGAGVLSRTGRMNLAIAVAAATAATLGADVLWYSLGRAYGTRVLEILCRFSQNTDSLIRHAKERFATHGVRYLIIAKFLPGVNPLTASLAGVVPIRPDRFLLHAAAGSVLWAGAWIMLGYLCGDVIGLVANRAARLWRPVLIAVTAGLIIYVVFKFVRRRRRPRIDDPPGDSRASSRCRNSPREAGDARRALRPSCPLTRRFSRSFARNSRPHPPFSIKSAAWYWRAHCSVARACSTQLRFDPYHLPRIQAVESEIDGWLTHLDRHPGERYVSDGESRRRDVPTKNAAKSRTHQHLEFLGQSSLRVSVFVQWVWMYVTRQRGSRLIVNHHGPSRGDSRDAGAEHAPSISFHEPS